MISTEDKERLKLDLKALLDLIEREDAKNIEVSYSSVRGHLNAASPPGDPLTTIAAQRRYIQLNVKVTVG